MSERGQKKRKGAPVGGNEAIVKTLSKIIPHEDLGDYQQECPADVEVWQCPFGEKCTKVHLPVWKRMWRRNQATKSMGFSNLKAHLVTCAGGEANLMDMYDDVCNADEDKIEDADQGHSSIKSFFQNSTVSRKARDCYGWLKWIVTKNQPITAVEDKEHRSFTKFNKHTMSYKRIVKVMNKVVELVEAAITAEIKRVKKAGGKASILHDGWSSSQNEHYVGLFMSYSKPVNGKHRDEPCVFWKPTIVLLACSPMDHHNTTDSDDNAQIQAAVNYNAKQYVEFISETLSYYNANISDGFIVCQTVDNAPVNPKIGRHLGIQTVGCSNHRFNLEVELFVQQNCAQLIDKVRQTMVSVKSSSVVRSMMRNKTPLEPLFYNDTRWYGKYFMLKRWLQLRPFCVEVNAELRNHAIASNRRKSIEIDSTLQFKAEVERFERYFESFNKIHIEMEKNNATLSDCRWPLDGLLQVLEANLPDHHPMYECELECKYILQGSDIVKCPAFESAVCKIQRGETNLMSAAEIRSVECLLQPATNTAGSIDDSDDDTELPNPILHSPTTYTRLKRQMTMREASRPRADKYVDTKFILGSVAVVERLWSMAKHILTDDRKRMMPIHLEALMFLKINQGYWSEETVEKAMRLLDTEAQA